MAFSAEIWGTVADWGILATAILASVAGVRQLKLIHQSNESASKSSAAAAEANIMAINIASAELLLQIDATFEGPDMYRSRTAFRSLRNRAEATVEREAKRKLTAQQSREAISAEFSHQMDLMWAESKKIDDVDLDDAKSADRVAADRYSELMALPNWIETMGLLCQRNLINTGDFLNLYDSVVIPTMEYIRNHIEQRRRDLPHPNPRFLENAYWLYESANAFKSEKEEPLPTPPERSPVKWTG
jgi:hypothetical protein